VQYRLFYMHTFLTSAYRYILGRYGCDDSVQHDIRPCSVIHILCVLYEIGKKIIKDFDLFEI
jgi:hypothetical protein